MSRGLTDRGHGTVSYVWFSSSVSSISIVSYQHLCFIACLYEEGIGTNAKVVVKDKCLEKSYFFRWFTNVSTVM